MDEILAVALKGWTPGAVGIWLILGSLLAALWKGLPSVMDAWSNSVGREQAQREREITRLENQIIASDKRHAECEDAQRGLREEINRLQQLISGLVIQMRQIQLSAAATGQPVDLPPRFAEMLKSLERPLT